MTTVDLRPITERVIEALGALPPSADEIAELFLDLGIDGTVADACGCPVATYLRQEVPSDFLLGWWQGAFALGAVESHELFEATATPYQNADGAFVHVQQFAKRFDDLGYPELVA